MLIDEVSKAYEAFRVAHRSRRQAGEEKYSYIECSPQRVALERQEKIFDDLERAKFEYMKLVLDEFWKEFKEVYDRWSEAVAEPKEGE